MRFEVKGGGIAAILFALTLLSGTVFALGLLAGYDVGRQAQIDATQLATSYPLQPPSGSPAPSNRTPAEPANPTMESASSANSPATEKSSGPALASADHKTAGPNGSRATPSEPNRSPVKKPFVAASNRATTRSNDTNVPVAEDTASSDSENPQTADESSEDTGDSSVEAGHKIASAATAVHRKPYNIQIEAAMDISGADQMMGRLQKLGYTSHLVPTVIAGQRWYKVEVGPYATAQEASSAEARLRQRYDETYGGAAHGNAGSQNGGSEDSEE